MSSVSANNYYEVDKRHSKTEYKDFYIAIMKGEAAAIDSEAAKLKNIIGEAQVAYAVDFAIASNQMESLKHLFSHTFPEVLKGSVYTPDLDAPLNINNVNELTLDTEYEFSFEDVDLAMHAERIIPVSLQYRKFEIFKMAVEEWELPIEPRAVKHAAARGLTDYIEIMIKKDPSTAEYLSTVTDEDLSLVAMQFENWSPMRYASDVNAANFFDQNFPLDFEAERRQIFERTFQYHGERFARCANGVIKDFQAEFYPLLCTLLKERDLLEIE